MKKSTKILTVLLAVCLLFGISSAFATSAAETNVLSVTNHSANVTDDCTSGPEGTDYGLASTGNSLYFGYENSVKSQYIQGTHVKDSTGENTYIRIHYMQGSADTPDPDQKYNHREASTRWRAYTSYNAAADLKNYKYMTLDFDFAADAYVYSFTLNGVKQYKTAASDEEFKKYLGTVTADPNKINEFYEEALATKDLAFPADETLRFNAVFQSSMTDSASGQALSASSSSAHWKQVHTDAIFIFKLDDGWYVGKTRDNAEGAVRLSNEAGVFDHITMVFELLDGGLTVRQHIYVNGNYMATLNDKAMDGDSKKYNTFYHLNIPFYQKVAIGTLSDKFYDKYSFAFDNVALNYYDASDVETPGGLGEFMASGDYTTESIMDCTNVVYNGDFIAPNAPVRAIITHNDGSEMVCYTKNSVHRNIRNGDFVTMYQSVENYSPSPDEIREVTFISQKETTLTLSKEAKEYFKVQHTNDRYTIRFGGENDMSIKWFDAAGEDRNVVKEQKLFPLQKPANNLVIGGEIEYAEGKQPTIGLLNSWLWDVDCDGVGDRPASEILERTFTMKEINEELREEGIYEIHLIPDYVKADVYYTVTTDSEKNELYVPDNNYAKFTDPSTLANTISKLEKGKTYYVTLYADVELSSRTMLLTKNVVLDFDVNGCKLGQSAESDSAIFTLSEGATLNLYSSKAGAEVYQNGDDLTGSAIISADNVDAASINLGKVTEDDPTGDNLTVYGASVVYLKGAESKSSNSNKIDVNVNGGNYYGTLAANGALFLVSEMDMVFNISNADMITANGEAIFSVVPAYATSSVIEVTNSNMLAGEVTDDGYVVGSFINEWSSNSKAYIKSSVVFGFENQLNVTLGADNKLNAKVSTDIAYDGEAIPVFSSNNATVVRFELNVPGYDETITADVEITLLTYPKNAIADSVKAVSWLDPEGNVYSTTYWVAGSVISVFESTEGFTVKDLDISFLFLL